MRANGFSEKGCAMDVSGEGEGRICRCIAEDAYAQEMRRVVEPYVNEGCSSGIMDGLYYEFYENDEPKGTIVISFGFTESCEKYHELICYMLREGYQAAVMAHRGHGKSMRECGDPELVHVEDFSQYVKDLHRFVQKIVLPRRKGAPLLLYAHSMGGCIGTLYLESYPGIFERAVLSAPMYGINNGKIPDFAAGLLCGAAILFGKKKERLFTAGGFDPDEPFESAGCDSRARHDYYLGLRRAHREYQTSGATYGWALAALRAGKRAISPANAAKIQIPVLLFQATDDAFVRAAEQELFLSRVAGSRKVTVKSRHEINRLPGKRLGRYLAEIFAFYGEAL